MPCYSPTGQICSKDEAYSAGRLRPGFTDIAEDGERFSFDLAFRDAAPARSGVFLTDTPNPYNLSHGRALAEARYGAAARDAGIAGLNAWRGGSYAADLRDAQIARDAARAEYIAELTGQPAAQPVRMPVDAADAQRIRDEARADYVRSLSAARYQG